MLKFSPKIRLGMLINIMLIKKNMCYRNCIIIIWAAASNTKKKPYWDFRRWKWR